MGRGFPGDLLCRSACEGGQPFAAPRFAQLIPKSHRRALVGLNQRFLNSSSVSVKARVMQEVLLRLNRGTRRVVTEGGDHGFWDFFDCVPIILKFAAE
jgi:hypothetical protein